MSTSTGLTFSLIYLTASCNIGSLLYGYDAGIISGSLIFIRKDFNMNATWQGMSVSSILFFAWIVSTFGGTLANKIGRKKSVIVSGIIYTVASGAMAMSIDKYTFLLSRCLLGIATGLSSAIVPLYVAECSPSKSRGSLVVVSFIAIVFGQLIASIIAATLHEYLGSNSWRFMLGAAIVPSLIHVVTCLFIPESPRFLMQINKPDQAKVALKKLRGCTDIEEEFKSIQDAIENSVSNDSNSSSSGFKEIFKQVLSEKYLRKALILGSSLQIIKQITGGTPVFYYTGSIIEMSGISDSNYILWSTAVVNLIFFLTTLIGFYLVDKIGRRKLMLTSLIGCIISLIIIATGFYLTQVNVNNINNSTIISRNNSADVSMYNSIEVYRMNYVNNDSSKYSIIIIIGLIIFLIFYGPGVGPMPFTINSEIFPIWCRGVCFAVTVGFAWSSNVIMTFTFLPLMELITTFGSFILFAALTLIGFIVLYFILPETKGIPLEEIEKVFITKKKLVNNNINVNKRDEVNDDGQTRF